MIDSAPKLFYTPVELNAKNYNEELKYVTLAFRRFWDLNNNSDSVSIVNIKYIRIELRNTEYNYVYVMEDCVDVFLDLYDLIK
jgi:hypothetical protein